MVVIVAPRELPPHVAERIKQVHRDVHLIATTDPAVLEQYWPRAEIVFGGRLDADTLGKCKNLRWIQTTSAGVEFYLYSGLLDKGIMLTNTRGMHGQTISEHIFMVMLAHARNLKTYFQQQKSRTWKKQKVELLQDKVLLVMGLGAIGQRTARIGASFGMRVEGIANTPKDLPFLQKTYTPSMLHQALPSADYIVLALPLTKKSKGILGAPEFSLMKESAFLVNIGRGELIHEEALIQALRQGRISGVGLDVFSTEPLGEDSPLWDMEQVIITPHSAGKMPDYLGEAASIFCANLKRYLEGDPLENLCDTEAGY